MSLVLSITGTIEWLSFYQAQKTEQLHPIDHWKDVDLECTKAVMVRKAIDIKDLNNILDSYSDTVLLFYRQPELFVADRANDFNFSLDLAANIWHEDITALLKIHKRHRKTLKLINLDQLLKCGSPDLLRLEHIAEGLYFAPADYVHEDRLTTLFACQYLHQNRNFHSTNELLYASSIFITEELWWTIDINFIYKNAQNNKKKAIHQTQGLIDENDLLLSKLHSLQLQFESSQDNYQSQLEALKSELTSAQIKMSELSCEQQKSDAIEKTLLSTLHETQALLENKQDELSQWEHACGDIVQLRAKLRENKRLIKQTATLKRELRSEQYLFAHMERELTAMKKSLAWKSTLPVRAASRLIHGNHNNTDSLKADCALLLTSELFDSMWYLEIYKDVAESGMNPAEHYILHGSKEKRYPSKLFDGNWYLENNPDVKEKGVNPLLHYLKCGKKEGRKSSPLLLEKAKGNNSKI